MRWSWEDVWLNTAINISKRSKCVNRQVGAVIVDGSNRPIAMGYNGPPANYKVDKDCGSFCPRGGSQNRPSDYANCVSVHAEANALLFADRRLLKDATIYITNPCCWECAKLIANSGIREVIMQASTADSHASWDREVWFLESCNIKTKIIERENNDV